MKRFVAFVLALLPFCAADAKPPARETVAAVLILEAGGTGVRGMTAVMHSINNRAVAAKKDYLSVVLRPKQYQVMAGGAEAAIRKARAHPHWGLALSIYDLFITHRQGNDFTLGATHFESFKHKNSYWAKSMKRTVWVGGNVFYRPKKNSKHNF